MAQGASLSRRGAAYFGMSGPGEYVAAAALFALMIILRALNIMYYRFDSDESQHLHVIWGWAHGLVQYRDLFDNHMPLFQIAFAPIFGLVGERATILYWMRFILLPMYCLAAWCTYRIAMLLFSRRVGVWAVILSGFYPGYHFTSFEFRTDNVWAPLWLLCITVLVSGALTVRRALVAGLLLGFCFGVSMKSTLFLLSIMVAVPIILFLVGRDKTGQSWAHLAWSSGAFVVGTLMVPGAIMTFFALKGIWREFRYCVFDYNIWAHYIEGHHSVPLRAVFPIVFALVIYAARLIVHAAPSPALAFRRGFVLLVCGFYLPALYGLWALRTREDYLPYHPLAFVFYTAAILAISNRLATCDLAVSPILRRAPLAAFVGLFCFWVLLATRPFWNDTARRETDLLRDIVTLTNPGDYVFDCKGQTVFRQRCCRPVLETITLQRIRRRIIPDNIARDCIETRTCVAAMMGRMPLGLKIFIQQNYLSVGDQLRVAGTFLKPAEHNSSRIDFDVVIPARYEIIASDTHVTGLLDGTPYGGTRFLERGKHTFVQTSAGQSLALIWAQAADRHFTPFSKGHSSGGG
jgi:dolichyl-phosphate-mannose-protein mannosyltransferase